VKVTMQHPELGEMDVLPITVPSWRARGWEVVEEKPTPPAESKEPAGEEPEDKSSDRPRRRSSKESE
jgi:hypothetical protein